MPNSARNHEQCRKIVCVICFSKCLQGRTVTEIQEKTIKKYLPGFNKNDSSFPSSICNACRMLITRNKLISIVDYRHLKTRSSKCDNCLCKICEVARLNYREKNKITTKKQSKQNSSNVSANIIHTCLKCFSPRGKMILCYSIIIIICQ